MVTQRYLARFWGRVRPFALSSGDQFGNILRRFGPFRSGDAGFATQAQELLDISANLTGEQKMIAEYWADGPRSETPPGHWNLFAQFVSRRDKHSLDNDVKMFFALNNALFDASIAAWDAKRQFDSVRPVTAIPFLFAGKSVRAWGGPGRGTVTMDGRDWTPYQASTFPTPPFPEFVSGHSTFSAVGATILALYTRSDTFGASVSSAPGSSRYEPGITPQTPGYPDMAHLLGSGQRGWQIAHLRRNSLHPRRSGGAARGTSRRCGRLAEAADLWNGEAQGNGKAEGQRR